MTVGDLRKQIEGLSDDIPVLVSAFDHGYRTVTFNFETARYVKARNYYCEDNGDD